MDLGSLPFVALQLSGVSSELGEAGIRIMDQRRARITQASRSASSGAFLCARDFIFDQAWEVNDSGHNSVDLSRFPFSEGRAAAHSFIKGTSTVLFAYGDRSSGQTGLLLEFVQIVVDELCLSGPVNMSCAQVVNGLFKDLMPFARSVELQRPPSSFRSTRPTQTAPHQSDIDSQTPMRIRAGVLEGLSSREVRTGSDAKSLYLRAHRLRARDSVGRRTSTLIVTITRNLPGNYGRIQIISLAPAVNPTDSILDVDVTPSSPSILPADPSKSAALRDTQLSIAALQRVVAALGRRSAFVPFRDHPLTTLLRPTLISPESRLALFVTLKSHPSNISDAMNTLRFARNFSLLGPPPDLFMVEKRQQEAVVFGLHSLQEQITEKLQSVETVSVPSQFNADVNMSANPGQHCLSLLASLLASLAADVESAAAARISVDRKLTPIGQVESRRRMFQEWESLMLWMQGKFDDSRRLDSPAQSSPVVEESEQLATRPFCDDSDPTMRSHRGMNPQPSDVVSTHSELDPELALFRELRGALRVLPFRVDVEAMCPWEQDSDACLLHEDHASSECMDQGASPFIGRASFRPSLHSLHSQPPSPILRPTLKHNRSGAFFPKNSRYRRLAEITRSVDEGSSGGSDVSVSRSAESKSNSAMFEAGSRRLLTRSSTTSADSLLQLRNSKNLETTLPQVSPLFRPRGTDDVNVNMNLETRLPQMSPLFRSRGTDDVSVNRMLETTLPQSHLFRPRDTDDVPVNRTVSHDAYPASGIGLKMLSDVGDGLLHCRSAEDGLAVQTTVDARVLEQNAPAVHRGSVSYEATSMSEMPQDGVSARVHLAPGIPGGAKSVDTAHLPPSSEKKGRRHGRAPREALVASAEDTFLRYVCLGRNDDAIRLYDESNSGQTSSLGAGVALDCVNEFGRDAIHLASRNGNLLLLRWLYSEGADFSLVGPNGDNAFSLAVWNGHLECMNFLFHRAHIDIDLRNEYGETAVHLAARRNELKALVLLQEMGLDMEAADNSGRTPLEHAPRGETRRYLADLHDEKCAPGSRLKTNKKNKEHTEAPQPQGLYGGSHGYTVGCGDEFF